MPQVTRGMGSRSRFGVLLTLAVVDTVQAKTPLFTFENATNYVYDVAWSPRHPGAFAYVSGCNISLVDITNDLEVGAKILSVTAAFEGTGSPPARLKSVHLLIPSALTAPGAGHLTRGEHGKQGGGQPPAVVCGRIQDGLRRRPRRGPYLQCWGGRLSYGS